MTRLIIPRVLSIGLLLVGAVTVVVAGVGLSRRLAALGGNQITPLTSPFGMVWTGVGLLVGVLLLRVGIRWVVTSVTVDEEGLHVRRLSGMTDLPYAALKGVVLQQSGSTPALRLVLHEGETIVLPGWSLRAVHDDGEVEPAGPALQRLGAIHRFKVKHATLLGPVEGGPRP